MNHVTKISNRMVPLFILCTLATIVKTESLPVKLYAIYTPSHEVLLKNWFLPSIKDDYEVVLRKAPQQCSTAHFLDKGWKETTLAKVDMIIDAIKENWDHWFVYSDVDITFYQKTMPILEAAMKEYDIALQKQDHRTNFACTGFFACRGNEKTLRLWKKARAYMQEYERESDQVAFNHALILDHNPCDVKHCLLSEKQFMHGNDDGWWPGRPMSVSKEIILHHANWTIGIPNKIKQLKLVRDIYKKMNQSKRKISVRRRAKVKR